MLLGVTCHVAGLARRLVCHLVSSLHDFVGSKNEGTHSYQAFLWQVVTGGETSYNSTLSNCFQEGSILAEKTNFLLVASLTSLFFPLFIVKIIIMQHGLGRTSVFIVSIYFEFWRSQIQSPASLV